MSGRSAREKRRQDRLREETEGNGQGRRTRMLQLGSAAGFLAVVVVAVLIVVSQSESGGDTSSIEGAADVRADLSGLDQNGLVLGDPAAKVTLVEFGDLQCPACKAVSEEVVPSVIESKVRSGVAKLDFRNFTIIGDESIDAGAAAVAAGEQGRGWEFVELFYRNQGQERSGYVTDEFMTSIAEAAGVPDITKWEEARRSEAAIDQVTAQTEEAKLRGLTGTPSFAVEGPLTDGLEDVGTPQSPGELESAVDNAG